MDRAAFRFRPRFRGVAWITMAIGAVVIATGAVTGVLGVAAAGAVGVVLGSVYLLSPAWALTVVVDDGGLEVERGGERRFHLAWSEIDRVLVDAPHRACFVDGGAPARSLLVPAPGMAPYAIENAPALVALILSHAPAAVVEETPELVAQAR